MDHVFECRRHEDQQEGAGSGVITPSENCQKQGLLPIFQNLLPAVGFLSSFTIKSTPKKDIDPAPSPPQKKEPTLRIHRPIWNNAGRTVCRDRHLVRFLCKMVQYHTSNFAKKCDNGVVKMIKSAVAGNGAAKIQRFNNMYNSAVFSLCDIMI